MRVAREKETLVLSVNLVESRLLSDVLQALLRDYRRPPGELEPTTRGTWYSTRGCESAKSSAEETAEWVAALHEGKGAVLERLQRWADQLGAAPDTGQRLRIACEDAPAFMTAINDYRLVAAARDRIGQAEIDLDWSNPAAGLSPERQRALLEIDFLAWIIEMMLYAAAS